MCLINPPGKFLQNMVNIQTKELQGIPCTDLQICFSENNIWRGSQVFRAIAVPKFQGGRSVLKCDMM